MATKKNLVLITLLIFSGLLFTWGVSTVNAESKKPEVVSDFSTHRDSPTSLAWDDQYSWSAEKKLSVGR